MRVFIKLTVVFFVMFLFLDSNVFAATKTIVKVFKGAVGVASTSTPEAEKVVTQGQELIVTDDGGMQINTFSVSDEDRRETKQEEGAQEGAIDIVTAQERVAVYEKIIRQFSEAICVQTRKLEALALLADNCIYDPQNQLANNPRTYAKALLSERLNLWYRPSVTNTRSINPKPGTFKLVGSNGVIFDMDFEIVCNDKPTGGARTVTCYFSEDNKIVAIKGEWIPRLPDGLDNYEIRRGDKIWDPTSMRVREQAQTQQYNANAPVQTMGVRQGTFTLTQDTDSLDIDNLRVVPGITSGDVYYGSPAADLQGIGPCFITSYVATPIAGGYAITDIRSYVPIIMTGNQNGGTLGGGVMVHAGITNQGNFFVIEVLWPGGNQITGRYKVNLNTGATTF